jgi:hypothetical protein
MTIDYLTVVKLCNEVLDLEPPITQDELETALKQLEMIRRPLLEHRVEAQIELIKKRQQYLHPKDRDLTELDRKLMLDVHTTAELQRFELLAGLEYLLKDRHATLSLFLDL